MMSGKVERNARTGLVMSRFRYGILPGLGFLAERHTRHGGGYRVHESYIGIGGFDDVEQSGSIAS